MVFEVRPHDLHADRQSARRAPRGRSRSRQVRKAGEPGPIKLRVVVLLAPIDDDPAIGPLAVLIVRKRRRRANRAKHHVVLLKKRRPCRAQRLAFRMRREPSTMILYVSAQHACTIALVVHRELRGLRARLRISVLAEQRAGRATQQLQVQGVCAQCVDARPRLIVDAGAGPGGGIGDRLDTIGHFAIHRAVRIVEDERNAKFPEVGLARSGQLDRPRQPLERLRPDDQVEREGEIFGAACERSADQNIERHMRARNPMAVLRHDTEARFVTVDAAVVRRIADRRADVAAQFERAHAGGERGGRAPR